MRYLFVCLSGLLLFLGVEANATTAPCPTITNVALNGIATQSTTHRGGVAERAIDGNTEGNFYHPDETVSTTTYEEEAWWQLDLREINDISEIRFWNQTGGNSTSNFYLFISDTPLSPDLNVNLNDPAVYSEFQAAPAGSPSVFTPNISGQYIQIQRNDWGFVTLAEFEVMACANTNGEDTTPPSVSISAPATVDTAFTLYVDFNEAIVDFDLDDLDLLNAVAYNLIDLGTGLNFTIEVSPVADSIVLSIPADKATDLAGNGNTSSNELVITYTTPSTGGGQNIAVNKPATQSNDRDTYSTADKAVDGNTNGSYYHPDQSVSSTSYGEDRWWEVDLQQVSDISEIKLFNQTGGNSTEDFYLFVSDVPFTSYDINTTINQSGVFNVFTAGDMGSPTVIPVNRTGRYVRVQVDGWGFNTLAEVEIYEPDLPPLEVVSFTYAELKKKLDGSFATFATDFLHFKYIEKYAITSGLNDKLRLNIYDKRRVLKTTGTVSNNYGINWVSFAPKLLLPDEYYILEVTGGNKGEKYYLRFTYD